MTAAARSARGRADVAEGFSREPTLHRCIAAMPGHGTVEYVATHAVVPILVAPRLWGEIDRVEDIAQFESRFAPAA